MKTSRIDPQITWYAAALSNSYRNVFYKGVLKVSTNLRNGTLNSEFERVSTEVWKGRLRTLFNTYLWQELEKKSVRSEFRLLCNVIGVPDYERVHIRHQVYTDLALTSST